MRVHFTRQLAQAAAACGAELRWLSDGWVGELTRNGRQCRIIGFWFPLNDSAAAQIANDKAATYAVLADQGVPAIPHRVFRPGRGSARSAPVHQVADVVDAADAIGPADHLAARAVALVPLPLVAKPLTGGFGNDVYRARTMPELDQVIRAVMVRHEALALSPYVPIAQEYRVVVLDDVVHLVYQKLRKSDWRHNLHAGAVPELVETGPVLARLCTLARQAMRLLNLRFAAVDIVDVRGRLVILEINNTIGMERFSAHSPRYAELAADVYRHAVRACLSGSAQ